MLAKEEVRVEVILIMKRIKMKVKRVLMIQKYQKIKINQVTIKLNQIRIMRVQAIKVQLTIKVNNPNLPNPNSKCKNLKARLQT